MEVRQKVKGVVGMAGMNGIWGGMNTNSVSYLFGNNQTKSTSSNLLGIDLGEYSSITRGSYSKLVKAYYKKYGNQKSSTEKLSDSKDSTQTKESIKSEADDLYKAADVLTTKGKDSLFKKADVKDEKTGTTTKQYDTDKIYKAVSSMVDTYNSFVKKSVSSKDNAVLRQAVGMVQSTSANGSLLGQIGIKVGSDNTLSIDEETFKKADMSTVKSLFNGSDSYGGRIQSAAGKVYRNVNNSLGNRNSYTASGTLGNYSTGNILDRFL